jgi:hypothetical protein
VAQKFMSKHTSTLLGLHASHEFWFPHKFQLLLDLPLPVQVKRHPSKEHRLDSDFFH